MDTQNPHLQSQQSSGLAITSLVLGILSLFLLGILGAIPGIITGHMARSKAKKNPEQFGGSGMALAGLILSYAVLILTIGGIAWGISNPEIMDVFKQAMEQGVASQ